MMRKTVSKMSLEKLIYYYAVLNFIARLPCCSFCRMLVNFFGVEYLRTVSKLKKEVCSMRAKKCTKNRMHVQSFANLNLLHFCPFLLWSSLLLKLYHVPLL